jgi:hypothetical protein
MAIGQRERAGELKPVRLRISGRSDASMSSPRISMHEAFSEFQIQAKRAGDT